MNKNNNYKKLNLLVGISLTINVILSLFLAMQILETENPSVENPSVENPSENPSELDRVCSRYFKVCV